MSLFNNFFGADSPSESKLQWNQLKSLNQLDEIIQQSAEKPVVIFKHSTRCSISRMALRQFESEFDLQDKVTAYFLDLISYRDISNEIANRFGVVHQSPQLIVIRDGKAVYDTSHGDIDAATLKSKV
jgi:bacillithiol system protein YtxJ